MSDIDSLREAFSYDPSTGVVTWKISPRRNVKAGVIAGSLLNGNRLRVLFKGRSYILARVAWAIVCGKWPTGVIDHINGDSTDNRLCNLRDVTVSVNTQNQKRPQGNNKSGFLGVSREKKKWKAQIRIDGITTRLGVFETPQEAHAAYVKAKREHHQGCTI